MRRITRSVYPLGTVLEVQHRDDDTAFYKAKVRSAGITYVS